MALSNSYTLDWDDSDRVSKTFTNKALITVESGHIAIGAYTEGSQPTATGTILHYNKPPHAVIVDGTVGFYNLFTGPNGERADVRILPFSTYE